LIVPIVLFYTGSRFFWIFLLFAYIPFFILWYKKLDKKLVFTWRVKRFFIVLIFFEFIEELSCFKECAHIGVLIPLISALIVSFSIEKILFLFYRQSAHKKLSSMKDLKIIAITASYGKTSIKNFLYELLKDEFITYKTPSSVNTEIGIIADINQKLPSNTQIYIAEAGARQRGDILQITRILQQDYAIIGQLGPQHLEYFKTLDTIKQAKREILVSSKMKKAFVHESAEIDTDLTGRANASMLDIIKVDVYGQKMPINQLGTITTPEARMINIQVWDLSNVTLIDSAVKQSELGLNPQIDGQLIRIPVPDLSEERRNEMKKMVKTMGEKCKIAVRNIRREANDQLKNLLK